MPAYELRHLAQLLDGIQELWVGKGASAAAFLINSLIDVPLERFEIGVPEFVAHVEWRHFQGANGAEADAEGGLASEPPGTLRKVGVFRAPVVIVALAAGGAAAFLRDLGTRLERRRIPFQAKVPVGPSLYARTDAGVIYLPSGPVVLCVLTNDNADHAWRPDNAGNLFCARAAKEVYDYFTAKK